MSVDLEKLRAGIVTVAVGNPRMPITIHDLEATRVLMRQAADEIEELRDRVRRLEHEALWGPNSEKPAPGGH